MKTKVAYVVVSSPNDIYLEQAYVSMFSLKHHMPDAYIVLLTDRLTSESLKGIRKEEVKYADEIIVVDYDGNHFNAQQRSRQIKTSIRNLIEGDFLYIDCDTIITRRLDDIDKTNALIAACRDSHCEFVDNPYRNMNIAIGHLLNWPIEDEPTFFNGGVTYVKDVPETHEFYRRWHENLNLGYEKYIYLDQPSFAKTNYDMNHIVSRLNDVWNCELKYGIRYLKDAYIVHYLCTNPSQYQNEQLFILNEKSVLLEVQETGQISDEIIHTIDNPFKGLAELTQTFSGEDIFFFRSPVYHYVRKHYHRDYSSKLMNLLRSLNYLERLYYRYIRILQGRATLKTPW